MEPFRPIVDRAVVKIVGKDGPKAPMDKKTKAVLLEGVMSRFDLEGESRTLFDVAARAAVSLLSVFEGSRKKIVLPEI
jgi:CRISPR/Cas system-associated endonuclease Cas1